MLGNFVEAGLNLAIFALLGWLISLLKKDVSIVDSMWSLMFLVAGLSYYFNRPELVTHCFGEECTGGESVRQIIVLSLLVIWSFRLSSYITWRNWGDEEDRRYQKIRERNEPHFWLKSLFIVFAFQALLALIISTPLYFSLTSQGDIWFLDWIALALVLTGIFFEAVADYQLARFKSKPENSGQVMDEGLWGLSRHPNYFGNFCIWWGFYFFGLAAGGWWTLFSPILMSFLLLKVSGVALLEKDIKERRPKYSNYIKRVNAFFPGPQKK